MTESFEYIRNKYCHEVLSALYFHNTGVARESTIKQMEEGQQGKLISDTLFFKFELTGLARKLNVTDILLQDVCEYLETNNHIESVVKNKGIFEAIRFTKPGVIAYKANFYLNENKKLEEGHWLKRSTLFNNWTTPFIALAALLVAIATLIKDCNCGQQQKTKASETQPVNKEMYHQSNNADTTPKLTKQDSLAKTKHK